MILGDFPVLMTIIFFVCPSDSLARSLDLDTVTYYVIIRIRELIARMASNDGNGYELLPLEEIRLA